MISYALFHVLMCHDVCQHVNISFSSFSIFWKSCTIVSRRCSSDFAFMHLVFDLAVHIYFGVAPGVSAPFGFSCFGGNVFTHVVITFPLLLLARWL